MSNKFIEIAFVIISIFFFLSSPALVKAQYNSDKTSQIIDSLEQMRIKALEIDDNTAPAYLISVNNQDDFSNLRVKIAQAINRGEKNIVVSLKKGNYTFVNNHLLFSFQGEDVSITIQGNKSTLWATSIHTPRKACEINSGVKYANGPIQIVDTIAKKCFIPCNLGNTPDALSDILITQWYTSKTYHVLETTELGVYFIADDLAPIKIRGRRGYNVNSDYLYNGGNPRYKFTTRPSSEEPSRFLLVKQSALKEFIIKDIVFKGNTGEYPLIEFKNVVATRILINNCEFNNIHSPVLVADNTNNIICSVNKIKQIYSNGFKFNNGCKNIFVINNAFNECGRGINNSFCILCRADNYLIKNNLFVNFGYGAIGVGVWHSHEKLYPTRGIIENNVLFYTSKYLKKKWKYTLMDSGAIYSWTQNDNVIIRYNYIHDYDGMGDNRGIFCDDGANNISIYRNVILNTPNSYSIDSRFVKDQKVNFSNNSNNFMADNVIDGDVRFQGYEGENRNVIKGANLIIYNQKQSSRNNKYEQVESIGEDVVLNDKRILNRRIKECTHQ